MRYMRDLMISIACMLALIVPWAIYSAYTEDVVNECNSVIDEELLPAIETGDWEKAVSDFDIVSRKWDDYKQIAAYFLSMDALNKVDGTVSKTYYYVKMNDGSNSSGEVANLKYELKFLWENESPSLANLL